MRQTEPKCGRCKHTVTTGKTVLTWIKITKGGKVKYYHTGCYGKYITNTNITITRKVKLNRKGGSNGNRGRVKGYTTQNRS